MHKRLQVEYFELQSFDYQDHTHIYMASLYNIIKMFYHWLLSAVWISLIFASV